MSEVMSGRDFCLACFSGNFEAVKKYEGDVDEMVSVYGYTSTGLHWAAAAGNEEITQYLLGTRKADPNVKEEGTGMTPLIWASNNGFTGLARCLVTNGANVDMTTNRGHTALIGAAGQGHIETVRCLVTELGADLSLKTTEHENSALALAAYTCKTPTVRCLVNELGADVHTRGYKGSTVLHSARSPDTAAALVGELGADPNLVDDKGRPAWLRKDSRPTSYASIGTYWGMGSECDIWLVMTATDPDTTIDKLPVWVQEWL